MTDIFSFYDDYEGKLLDIYEYFGINTVPEPVTPETHPREKRQIMMGLALLCIGGLLGYGIEKYVTQGELTSIHAAITGTVERQNGLVTHTHMEDVKITILYGN